MFKIINFVFKLKRIWPKPKTPNVFMGLRKKFQPNCNKVKYNCINIGSIQAPQMILKIDYFDLQ